MALLSAFAALVAALSAHESLVDSTEEILDFVALETDRIEIEVLRAKHDILRQFDETPPASEVARIRGYREEAESLTERTGEEEVRTGVATRAHLIFAVAVTLLSIGITLGGMAIIARRRFLWLVGLVFGVAGTVAVALGFRDLAGF